jgi:hypothetical protein
MCFWAKMPLAMPIARWEGGSETKHCKPGDLPEHVLMIFTAGDRCEKETIGLIWPVFSCLLLPIRLIFGATTLKGKEADDISYKVYLNRINEHFTGKSLCSTSARSSPYRRDGTSNNLAWISIWYCPPDYRV